MRSDAAPDPDCIPAIILKKCAQSLCEPLASIFNVSFYSGQIPEIWRRASITVIYKGKGNIEDCINMNNRPISLTRIPCKIQESLIKEKVSDHLDNNNLISHHRHGFRAKRSTVTQLLECMND